MFNTKLVTIKTACQMLALAMAFCLSGMSNVVCCLTKCAVIIEKSTSIKHNSKATQENTCHKNPITSLSNDEDGCCKSQDTGSFTSNLFTTSDLKADYINLEEGSVFTSVNGFQCKMICCLPSDQVVDIPQISQVNPLVNISNPHPSFSTSTVEKNSFSIWPIEKFLNQERTYLRCCVFLI